MQLKFGKCLFFMAAVCSTWMNTVCADPGVDITLTFDEFLLPHAYLQLNETPMVLNVDTGSSFAFHLFPDQIEAIGARKSHQTRHTVDAAGNMQENTLYTAKDLSLNGIKLGETTIVPLQQWGLMMSGVGEPPIAPVIGLAAFKGKVLALDYRNKVMRVAETMPEAWIAGGRFLDYPFVEAPEGLIFNVKHAGQLFRLVLDTGASVSAIWNERLTSTFREDCAVINPELEYEGCQAVRLHAISSNGTRDPFTAVATTGNFDHMEGVDGLLGNNFLESRTVVIDFARRKLWVSAPPPPDAAAARPPPKAARPGPSVARVACRQNTTATPACTPCVRCCDDRRAL